jgi:hypothetical protein
VSLRSEDTVQLNIPFNTIFSIANCWPKIPAVFPAIFGTVRRVSKCSYIPRFISEHLTMFCGNLVGKRGPDWSNEPARVNPLFVRLTRNSTPDKHAESECQFMNLLSDTPIQPARILRSGFESVIPPVQDRAHL